MTERELYLWLAANTELETGEKNKLLKFFGNIGELWNANETLLGKSGFSSRITEAVTRSKKIFNPEEINTEMYRYGIKFVSISEKNYPEKLRLTDAPPVGLFYKGTLPVQDCPSAAVIGARLCSDYGKTVTEILVRELTGYGIQIISGLAAGIDGYAHKAALAVEGKTYGILGTGIEKVYPKENYGLYKEMYKRGGVISEYYIGTKNIKSHFPERNRIIAGLSDCVIVVEARKKSGTMITTDRALEQGKEVFVVPGRIGDACSEGCLLLARQGAAIMTSAEDVTECLRGQYQNRFLYEKNKGKRRPFVVNEKSDENVKILLPDKNGLENHEIIVYALLSFKPKHFEQLAAESGLDYFSVMEAITSLCRRGLAAETSPEYYIRSE